LPNPEPAKFYDIASQARQADGAPFSSPAARALPHSPKLLPTPAVQLRIKRLTLTAKLPVRTTEHASCLDVYADMDGTIAPGERLLVKTGLSVAVPPGYEVQVRSRSGLALKHGVMVLNSPGTVDADYRGEVGVILINFGKESFGFRQGERIAQMGVYPVVMCPAEEVETLDETARGGGGFGHTGR
jgi:dUTP pyrophosphatase